MYRLTRISSAVLLLFAGALFLTACVDTGEPEALDEADDADIIADDDMPAEPMEEDLDIWPNFDTNDDDYVTMEEFGPGYEGSGMYADYDTNGDSFVSEAEYTAANGMAEDYATYDVNGDGQLSMEEFRDGMFQKMDTDGDGRVSRAEFDQHMMMHEDSMMDDDAM